MNRLSAWFAILLCIVSLSTSAQRFKISKVTVDDLAAKYYPLDSAAEAVVLGEYGSVEITDNDIKGYYAVHRRIRRIKILKKSAYDRATISVHQYRRGADSEEVIRNIKGKTYWLENGEIKSEDLSRSAIFTSKTNKNFYETKFTLPHVQEGCIIEYEYDLMSDFILQLPSWDFQTDIPIKYSEYYATFPPKLGYRAVFQNPVDLVIKEYSENPNTGTFMRYAVKDQPALRPEPYITTIDDYTTRLRFELVEAMVNGRIQRFSQSWLDVDKKMATDDEVGSYIRKTTFLKAVAKEIKSKYSDTLSIIKEAHRYIRTNMTWNGHVSYWSASSPKTIFEQKTGNSAEINLILIGLIRELGFEASPVILSTRSNGAVFMAIPMISYFNDLVGITNIGGKEVLLDATDTFLPLGVLPDRCLTRIGRIVDIKHANWVYLKPTLTRQVKTLQYTLDESGSAKGSISYSWQGELACRYRNAIQKSGIKKFGKELIKQPSAEVGESKVENATEIDKPLIVTTEVSYEETFNKAGDRIYLSPALGEALSVNPFKYEKRMYPVDFGNPSEEVFMANIKIPQGYVVESSPATQVIALPEDGGRFTYQVQVHGEDIINVVTRLQLKKPIYSSEEYPYLKKLMDMAIAKNGEQIILKKK
ncbi:transglutaminase domain-containing protein [Siphonobacter sp. SORGH_AS_1065]|uniref:transglutaminase domain-containing protein n=1 Tax=Siphonobacter sp. SORGH_AS_1065 TaxID=3041795 RepID=UPI00277DE98B|nr:transglutaminase domain-containing protein [Siphonobacter sp. SORGH_AS_1065]MDQ1088692.1 hypothetical protein [Siphonobacter sp. SORGH_AS_1065]